MVFSSLPFLFFFLPIVFIGYFLVANKYKNKILLIASMIFYAWGEPIYIVLLIFSSIVDYTNGRMIEKYINQPKRKRLFMVLSIVVNLSLLGFFKYSGFLVETITGILGISGISFSIGLPIGISFYTFQTMSYSIDVYNQKVKAEHNFWDFMTYVSMFPQLIAGPIVRYQTISEQLHQRIISFNDFSEGMLRFIRGLGKKVLLANNIGLLFTLATTTSLNSVVLNWLGIIAFGLQIYFDFSGYSDMAIGMGRMLGFTYLENFNFPYIAKSITDFWRRWHISLSGFFRDYVYIPLGGNRVSTSRNIFNILLVWALTGLWHGAAWNFIIWGFYYGLLLVLEKFILKKFLAMLPSFLQHTYTIFFVLIGWSIFCFDDLGLLINYMQGMFGFGGISLINSYTLYLISNYMITILLCLLFCLPFIKKISDYLKNNLIYQIGVVVVYFGVMILSTAYLVDASFNPFLYFRF